jgi:hypothetical protein
MGEMDWPIHPSSRTASIFIHPIPCPHSSISGFALGLNAGAVTAKSWTVSSNLRKSSMWTESETAVNYPIARYFVFRMWLQV